jgi:hypothetical protein
VDFSSGRGEHFEKGNAPAHVGVSIFNTLALKKKNLMIYPQGITRKKIKIKI